MKFALINTFYGYGSTGQNVVKQCNMLRNMGHDVIAFYGRIKQDADDTSMFIGDSVSTYVDDHISRYLGLSGMFSPLPTYRLLKALKKFKPDVVWLNNIHGNYLNEYILLSYLKQKKICTVYSMPDEYAFLGKCCCVTDCMKFKSREGCSHCNHLSDYPLSLYFDNSRIKFKLKERAYKGFDNIVFRSAPYVINNAKESWLLKDKTLIMNDSATDISGMFYPRNASSLREQYGIGDNTKVVIVCAPISDRLKGVNYFLEAARKCVNDDILFINVAYDGDKNGLPPNYLPLPFVTDMNILAKLYSLADAYVCTSVSDAQPGTCREALGCGTPIIGFRISGIPYIAPNEFGVFVTPFNVDELAQAIRVQPRKTSSTIELCHNYAEKRFDIQVARQRNENFINEICEHVNQKKLKW